MNREIWLMAAGFGVPGGIEAHIVHYAAELRRRGWNPQVVIFADFPTPAHRFMAALDAAAVPRQSLNRLARRRTLARFAVRVLPWMLVQLVKGRRPQPRLLLSWLASQGQIARLNRLLVDSPPDVIHIFGRLPHPAWAALPADRTIFHQMMTGDIDGIWTEAELAAFAGFCERCAAVLAPGEGVIANLRRYFGLQCDILPVATLCPDALGPAPAAALIEQRRAAAPRPLRFGVICRLTEQKGIAYLLEALVAYQARYGEVHFAFAGEGELEATIRAAVQQHGLRQVTLERVLDPVAFLSTIDVFVHPSIGDAMPMAIAEALMCALPCVVSRVGGCPDLVREGVEGFVIEPRRPEAILECLIRFTEMSADERAAFGQRARQRYEAVCLPAAVGAVVGAVYERIWGGAGGVGRGD